MPGMPEENTPAAPEGQQDPETGNEETPPPAALRVIEGKTERELELENELAAERETRKKREIRLSELEDENRQLKTVGLKPAPPAKGMWDEFFNR